MPYKIQKTKKGWGVKNVETGKWKSKNTTFEKAERQRRLLAGVETGKWKPTGTAPKRPVKRAKVRARELRRQLKK